MKDIDLENLTEAELIALHDAVIDRLHALHLVKTAKALSTLSIGQRVSFTDNSGEKQHGIIIRRNRKTMTVHSQNGRQWNVSPQLLSPENEVKNADRGNIVSFKPPQSERKP